MKEKFEALTISRDIQMLIGQKLTAVHRNRFIDSGDFNFFCCPEFYRSFSLEALSKLTIFTLNHSQVQLRSSGKEFLRIDLSRSFGYLYLDRLVKLVATKYSATFFTEIYLISLQNVNFNKLMGILENLKGITVLSLPYEFGNRRSNKMERLIQNNAGTLLALKHITFPMVMPAKMRERCTAVHTSTLRNGTLEKEQDFYAFYTSGAKYPDSLLPAPNSSDVVFRIEVHRHSEPFRAPRKAFTSGSNDFLSKITVLKFTSIFLSGLETASTHILLNKLAGAQRVFPNLTLLELELKMLDAYPNHFPPQYIEEDENENDIVSPMALDSTQLGEQTIAWLVNSQNLPFCVTARVFLSVDYVVNESEEQIPLLERAMKQTIVNFAGTRWAQIQSKLEGTHCTAMEIERLSDKLQFIYALEYRSSIVSKKGYSDAVLFNIGHCL